MPLSGYTMKRTICLQKSAIHSHVTVYKRLRERSRIECVVYGS